MMYRVRGVTCPSTLAGLRTADCDGGGQQRPLGLGLGPGTSPGLGLGQAGEVSHLSCSGSSHTKEGNLDVI